jgi:diguanylate cyclase (GGDEF)-like protein
MMASSARAPLAGRLAQVVEAQTAIARAGLNLKGVLRLVAGQARELTGASGAAVVLAEGEPTLSGMPELDPGLIERCLKEGTVARDANAVAVPVRVGGRPAAVLAATWNPPDTPLAEDVQVLQLLAGLLGAPLAEAAGSIDDNFELERLAHFSTHDVVTSLPNRALIADRLRHALTLARRARSRLCVMVVDLDGFTALNEEIGHALGDQVLRTAASRLRAAVREPDTVARMQGARFLVLLAGDVTPGGAGVLASRLFAAMEKPVVVGARSVQMRALVGTAFYPYDGLEAESLVSRAEQALALAGPEPA